MHVQNRNCGPPKQSLNDKENSVRHKVNKPPRSQPSKYNSAQRTAASRSSLAVPASYRSGRWSTRWSNYKTSYVFPKNQHDGSGIRNNRQNLFYPLSMSYAIALYLCQVLAVLYLWEQCLLNWKKSYWKLLKNNDFFFFLNPIILQLSEVFFSFIFWEFVVGLMTKCKQFAQEKNINWDTTFSILFWWP